MLELIAKQKTAAVSKTIYLGNDNNDSWPTAAATLYFLGASLAGGETIKVQYYDEDADTWRDMYVDDTAITLTATDNVKTIYGPLEFRVAKSTTLATVGVGISQIKGLTV